MPVGVAIDVFLSQIINESYLIVRDWFAGFSIYFVITWFCFRMLSYLIPIAKSLLFLDNHIRRHTRQRVSDEWKCHRIVNSWLKGINATDKKAIVRRLLCFVYANIVMTTLLSRSVLQNGFSLVLKVFDIGFVRYYVVCTSFDCRNRFIWLNIFHSYTSSLLCDASVYAPRLFTLNSRLEDAKGKISRKYFIVCVSR